MIFGKGYSVVKATDDSFEFEMLYTGIIPDFIDESIIENESPINGERDYLKLWDHMTFKLRVYLFKHDEPGSLYNQISQIRGKEFYFKPHKFQSDGVALANWLKDEDGNDQVFYCSEFKPYYLENVNHFDIIEITLKSKKPSMIESLGKSITSFTFDSRTASDVGAQQGVAWDGTYFYTACGHEDNFHIYKWNSSWVLQDSVDCEADLPVGATQINSIFYKDGYLYVGVTNWQSVPRLGWIAVYQASDLSYNTIHAVQGHWCEGCAFHDGYWWVVYYGTEAAKIVSKYNESWVHQADYALTFEQDVYMYYGYQGIRWVDGYIYVNPHSGTDPQTLDIYHYNGAGFDEVARLAQPNSKCIQGIEIDPINKIIWWAERDYGDDSDDDRVLKTYYTFGYQ